MNNEILEILHDEQERIVKMLPGLDPTTEGYACALRNLGELQWRTRPDGLPVIVPVDAVPRPVIVPVEEPEPTPVEPTPEPVVEAPAPAQDMSDYRMGLRERMADARLKGVNITDLIKKVGADKFSAVPDDKLTELSDLLESAVKELE
jgi:hypothetical protein